MPYEAIIQNPRTRRVAQVTWLTLNNPTITYNSSSGSSDMDRSCPDSRSRAFNVPIGPIPHTAGQLYAPVANRSYPSLRLLRISAPAGFGTLVAGTAGKLDAEGGILTTNAFEE